MYENFTDHDLLETPAAVVAEARHLVDVYQARHDGFFPPSHHLAGNNSECASVGLPRPLLGVCGCRPHRRAP
jgi:hypothetical protein